MKKVKLKAELNGYLALTSAGKSFIIHKGGKMDPEGFEVSDWDYLNVFKPYVDLVVEKKEVLGTTLGTKSEKK